MTPFLGGGWKFERKSLRERSRCEDPSRISISRRPSIERMNRANKHVLSYVFFFFILLERTNVSRLPGRAIVLRFNRCFTEKNVASVFTDRSSPETPRRRPGIKIHRWLEIHRTMNSVGKIAISTRFRFVFFFFFPLPLFPFSPFFIANAIFTRCWFTIDAIPAKR